MRRHGEETALADQRPEGPRRVAAGREEGRSRGAGPGAGSDADAGALAEVLGEVPRAAAQSARAARGHALDQAGRAHRTPEGLEAAEALAAGREAAQTEGKSPSSTRRARPRSGGRGGAADPALRVTRAVVIVNPAAGGGRTARM